MSIEAMKQALEALETARRFVYSDNRPQCDAAITALRTAIEQAEKQEPPYRAVKTVHEGKPVYVSEPAAPVQDECVVCGDKVRVIPRPWVGLTDEEIDKHLSEDAQGDCEMHEFARAIEAKLREKNGGQA